MRGRALFAALLFAWLAAACTPHVVPLGRQVGEPVLTHDSIVTADGTTLPLKVWKPGSRPPESVLLALHGFNDYGNFFEGAGTWLAGQGVAVYAYDQRGFGATATAGLWSGTEAMTDDVRTVVDLLRGTYPGLPLYLLGDSMGGAVAMVAMTRPEPPDVDGVILVAPAVWGRETMPWYQRWALETSAHTVPWLLVSGVGLDIRPSDNLPMLYKQWEDPLVIKDTRVDAVYGLVGLMDTALSAASRFRPRSLILYGEKDEIIPRAPTRLMLSRLPKDATEHRTLAIYEGGYHMLLRDIGAETYWNDLLHWMRSPGSGLPSSADRRAPDFLDAASSVR